MRNHLKIEIITTSTKKNLKKLLNFLGNRELIFLNYSQNCY